MVYQDCNFVNGVYISLNVLSMHQTIELLFYFHYLRWWEIWQTGN